MASTEAILHVFGKTGGVRGRIHPHPPPAESETVFNRDSALVVPLRVGSGVRMKILEAWARGVPVVATSVAARGTAIRSDELLIADDASAFDQAIETLLSTHDRDRVVQCASEHLRRHHDPGRIASRLTELFNRAR
jgi:glycosyltransferase involved in cell wall biosynthesis